jgi:hypothetical protein
VKGELPRRLLLLQPSLFLVIRDETPVHSFLFTGFILLYCALSGAVGIEGALTNFLRFGFI